MKALVLDRYGSPDDLRIAEVEQPVAKANQVLVRVIATSVNDWDWCIVRGKPFYIRLLCGLARPKVRIPGVDIAGRVEAVGADVRRFRVGDAVYGDLSECGFGGFAEFVCAPETALEKKPEAIDFVEAAAIPHAGLLAWQGLCDVGGLEPRHKVLFNGAGGGVGTLGVQIAGALGASEIIGVDSSDKFAAMRQAGFEQTIDYRQQDFTSLEAACDLILDPKTDRPPWRYLRALRTNGVYVTVGGLTGKLLQLLMLAPLYRRWGGKSLRILGLKPNQGLADLAPLIEAGKLRPVIDGPYPFDEIVSAVRRFGRGEHVGKVVVVVSESG